MSSARADTIRLIARQLAIMNGQVFDKLGEKTRRLYVTTAETIVATVERKLQAEDDRIFGYIDWL